MAETLDNWAARIRAGEVRAISRAITAIENREPAAHELLQLLFPSTGRAYVIGVTGTAGSGKSTLVDRLATWYREQGHTVGIIAVDPTSPYTGGAVLGDRIRMQRHATDAGIFIRSMATRGTMGGLATATADVALLLDAAGKQIVIIETVGVGQDEIDVARLAHCTLVVVVPGLGDDVQNMKAGLMESADIFILNKSDREGADGLEQQLAAMLELVPGKWQPPIVRTTATTGDGIVELAEAIERFRARIETTGESRAKALAHWKSRVLALVEEKCLERAVGGTGGQHLLESLASEVLDRKKSPYEAAGELLARAGV